MHDQDSKTWDAYLMRQIVQYLQVQVPSLVNQVRILGYSCRKKSHLCLSGYQGDRDVAQPPA